MTSPQHKMSDDDLIRLAEDIEALETSVDNGANDAAEMVAETDEFAEQLRVPEPVTRETLNREAQVRTERLREEVNPKPAPKPRPTPKSAAPKRTSKKVVAEERFEFKLPETQHEWTDFGIKFGICAVGAWLISTAIPMLVSLAAVIVLAYLVWDNLRKSEKR